MKKYRVVGIVTGSKYIGEFEANSKEEAEDLAWDSDETCVTLCHACSSECEDAEIQELYIEEIKE